MKHSLARLQRQKIFTVEFRITIWSLRLSSSLPWHCSRVYYHPKAKECATIPDSIKQVAVSVKSGGKESCTTEAKIKDSVLEQVEWGEELVILCDMHRKEGTGRFKEKNAKFLLKGSQEGKPNSLIKLGTAQVDLSTYIQSDGGEEGATQNEENDSWIGEIELLAVDSTKPIGVICATIVPVFVQGSLKPPKTESVVALGDVAELHQECCLSQHNASSATPQECEVEVSVLGCNINVQVNSMVDGGIDPPDEVGGAAATAGSSIIRTLLRVVGSSPSLLPKNTPPSLIQSPHLHPLAEKRSQQTPELPYDRKHCNPENSPEASPSSLDPAQGASSPQHLILNGGDQAKGHFGSLSTFSLSRGWSLLGTSSASVGEKVGVRRAWERAPADQSEGLCGAKKLEIWSRAKSFGDSVPEGVFFSRSVCNTTLPPAYCANPPTYQTEENGKIQGLKGKGEEELRRMLGELQQEVLTKDEVVSAQNRKLRELEEKQAASEKEIWRLRQELSQTQPSGGDLLRSGSGKDACCRGRSNELAKTEEHLTKAYMTLVRTLEGQIEDLQAALDAERAKTFSPPSSFSSHAWKRWCFRHEGHHVADTAAI